MSFEIRDTHQKLVKVFRESDRFEKWRKGKERRKTGQLLRTRIGDRQLA